MSPTTSSSTEIVRRVFLKIDEETTLGAVDSLDLRGHGKISAVVGIPLRNLQQRRDVTTFATTAPIAALHALLELLALTPLEKVVAVLGDEADNPSFEELQSAVDHLLGDGCSVDDIVALLAFAVVEEFAAAGHCRRLLGERAQFELPALPDAVATSSLVVPKVTDPQIREERRARREQEKQRKKGPSSLRPARPTKAKREEPSPSSASGVATSLTVPVRRRMLLTPAELERFNAEHPLAGWVVLAEVPFDAVDPTIPEQRSKERPALVVAANDEGALVRAIYSSPTVSRRLFQAWRRLGLDHVSYIDDARVVLPGATDTLNRLGRLNDREWNALL